MDPLNVVFGGKTRMRLMRLFLLNPDRVYEIAAVEKFCGGKRREVEQELSDFVKIGLIKRKKLSREEKGKHVTAFGWALHNSFVYLLPLRTMLVDSVVMRNRDIVKRLQKGGPLKLVVLAGIFIKNWESRIDLLVVGDMHKKKIIERVLCSIEDEVGRELHYSILSVSDFQYRLSVGDKLIRDIFDFPHQVAINKGLISAKRVRE